MAKSLRLAYANTLRWHKNEAEMGRKLILASVYSVDGDILMQLPIPPMDSFSKLTEYVNAIWANHGVLDEDTFSDKIVEALREEGYEGEGTTIALSTDCELPNEPYRWAGEDTWVDGGNRNPAAPDYTREILGKKGLAGAVKETTRLSL